MALQKQPVSINFSQGLNTKADPFQLPVGQFLALNNSVFTTAGRLTKRNGYQNLTPLPSDAGATTLTTLNDNLTATGPNLFALSADTDQWINKGSVQPVSLETQPLIRVSTSQTSPDTAIAPSGLTLLVYMDNSQGYYQITDSVTNQQIVSRIKLPNTGINPRAFVLGNYFIITFVGNVAAAPKLQYIYIPIVNPNNPSPAINFTTEAQMLDFNSGYDGVVFKNAFGNPTALYLAWEGSNGAVNVAFLTTALILSSSSQAATAAADLVSITVDVNLGYIWVTYWDSGTTNISAVPLIAATLIPGSPGIVVAGVVINELTSISVLNTSIFIYYQTTNTYASPYPGGPVSNQPVRSDFISEVFFNIAQVATGPEVVIRSAGIASKPFVGPNNLVYMLIAYGDNQQASSLDNSNQPSYFLMGVSSDFNGTHHGSLYMRLAYSNGGGYARSQVLPNVTELNDQFYIPYLNNDFLATTNSSTPSGTGPNKTTPLPAGTPSNAIYTQTGVNLSIFSINNSGQHSSEIASALHLTGGQLWEYDGVKPVEHSFQVWPENASFSIVGSGGALTNRTYNYVFTYEWTDNAGNLHRSAPSIPMSVIVPTGMAVTFTSTFMSGDKSLTVSSASGLVVGQIITDTTTPTNFAANTYITSIVGSVITISQPTEGDSASSGTAPDTITTLTTCINTLYVPTLRLTSKQPFFAPTNIAVTNPVRIVGYRWSAAQPVYYQFTSLTTPNLNDTTIDFISITDGQADTSILGNTILYTTGSVIENIAAPASIHSALFKSRLFLIDAEDRNLLWFSKQVISNTPVEMSDLLTLYVAPTSGAQGSTGPMTALSAMDDKLIIFKKDAIYYVTGQGPDNTGANNDFTDPIFVSSSVGTSNPNSIVLTPNGLMFQSDKGIWLLDRSLQTSYIGASVESFNSLQVMSAQVIPATTQVRFVLEDNTTLMYDYFYNQWGTHSNISAIFATLYQGQHTYLNSFGQIYQELPGTYVDGSEAVLMSLTTSWINIAGLQGFERFYFANLLGVYKSPFKLAVTLAYNYNPSATQSITVTPDNFTPAWGDEALWGSGGGWGADGGKEANVFSARLFPTTQKCQSFQVNIQEVYDPSFNVPAGEGLTLSGLALIVGMKRGFRTQSAKRSFG